MLRNLIALVLSGVAPAIAAPHAYDLDPRQGRIYVVVRAERGGLFGALAHDHVVVATRFTGTVTWDPDNVAACDVRIQVPVDGLSVDPGAARTWVGLEGTTSDSDKATIKENLSGDRQLDRARFPTITYRSTSCAPAEGGARVTGVMTVHGVERSVTLPMRITANDASFVASGSFDATHADFGMTPFRALAGAIRNEERLSFVVDVRGVPQAVPPTGG
jgi:polyisoprenoid-binding protein YceI